MCWHKWGKWEQFERIIAAVSSPFFTTTYDFPVAVLWEKRVCSKCGKMKMRKVR